MPRPPQTASHNLNAAVNISSGSLGNPRAAASTAGSRSASHAIGSGGASIRRSSRMRISPALGGLLLCTARPNMALGRMEMVLRQVLRLGGGASSCPLPVHPLHGEQRGRQRAHRKLPGNEKPEKGRRFVGESNPSSIDPVLHSRPTRLLSECLLKPECVGLVGSSAWLSCLSSEARGESSPGQDASLGITTATPSPGSSFPSVFARACVEGGNQKGGASKSGWPTRAAR